MTRLLLYQEAPLLESSSYIQPLFPTKYRECYMDGVLTLEQFMPEQFMLLNCGVGEDS